MDSKLKKIQEKIKDCPDFPKPGIIFKDIMGVFMCPETSRLATDVMTEHIRERCCSNGQKIDVIAGLEARGFLFGPIIAQNLNCSFCPIRKAGKLPGECYSLDYGLEYGKDRIELQKTAVLPGHNVVIVDDLLATGGTMEAASSLVEQCGGNILDCVVLIELCDLKGRDKLKHSCSSLLRY